MIDKIMRLLGYERIDRIKIFKRFRERKPSNNKMNIKREYYCLKGKFMEPVILINGYLVDGYTTYLLAQELGKKYIKVWRI